MRSITAFTYSQSVAEHPRCESSVAAPRHSARRALWSIPAGFGLLLLALKIIDAYVLRIDSDEPQHLHVVWGWTQGLLPYRDLFDNHSPLFQMLCAPLFHLFGERADIIIPMRLAMIPFYLATIWGAYRVASLLFSKSAALWAAAFTAAFPSLFHTSTEFRTDDPWVALWMLALVVVLGAPLAADRAPRFSLSRAFMAGFVFGLLFSVSMKTTLLLLALLMAAAVTLLLMRAVKEAVSFRLVASRALAAAAGMVIVPAGLVAYFASQGAYRALLYCVIQHNTLAGLGSWSHVTAHQLLFLMEFPLLIAGAWLIFKLAPNPAISARRTLIFLTAGFFVTLLRSFWPLVTPQDYLPFIPLLCILAAGLLFDGADRLRPMRFVTPRWENAAAGVILLAEILALVIAHPPWRNDTAEPIRLLGETLRLTHPSDYVMDSKGETIFRRRPYYYVLESITEARIAKGLIPDDISDFLMTTRTCVAKTKRLPPHALAFVKKNYLEIPGKLLVAGQMLKAPEPDGSFTFDIAIPASYELITDARAVKGLLDGTPYTGARNLEAGTHHFTPNGNSGPLAIFWAQAAACGYSPFQKQQKGAG